jgi:AsmA protein
LRQLLASGGSRFTGQGQCTAELAHRYSRLGNLLVLSLMVYVCVVLSMRKLLLVSFSILIGIVFSILFIPQIFKRQIAAALKNELNSNVHAEINFSVAEINLWRNFPQFTATLDNFSIAGKKEFFGDTLVRAKELHLVLGTFQLLFNEGIEIKHLDIIEPDIFISILQNGRTNYDIANSEPDDSTHSVVLNIESWEISKGKFRYKDETNGFYLETQKVALDGDISIKDEVTDFNIEGTTEAFAVSYSLKKYIKDKSIGLNVRGSYNAKTNSLHFSENSISVNNLGLTFSGLLAFKHEDVDVDLKIKSKDAEFKDVLSLSQALFKDFDKMHIQGHMALGAEFLGTYNGEKNLFPAFKMNLVVNEGSIKYHSLPSSLNEINFELAAFNTDGNLDNTIVALQYLGMNVGTSPLFGSAEIKGFNNGSINADLLANIPLAELSRIYPMEGLDLSGNLEVQLKANGSYTGHIKDLATRRDWRTTKIPAFTIGVNLTGGNIRYTNLPEAFKDINVHVYADNKTGVIDDTQVKIEKLQAMMGENPIRGSVTLTGVSEPVINGGITATLNLEEVKDFYPLEHLTLKGLVDLDLKVDGKWSTASKLFPKVLATFKVGNGFIQSDEYPAPMENMHLVLQAINGTGKFADTRFVVDTLTYQIENESFAVNGFIQDLEKYNYDLTIKGILYLDKLQKILSLDDVILRGEIDVDLKTAGNLSDLRAKKYHRLPTEGSLRLKDVFVKNDMFYHGLHVKEGNLLFTNEKIFLDTLHGALGESHFNLTGRLYNYLAYLFHNDETIKGDLLFESANFDINELIREKKTFKDTIHHDLEVLKIPANIDFTFDSKIGLLHYKNLDLNDLKGKIRIHNGVLTLDETTFSAMDAAFRISGDYDPRETKPKFDIDLGIHDLNISKAHDAFATIQAIAPAAEHTYGLFSIDYKLKGDLTQSLVPVFESLEGEGTVRIRDAKINGMKVFHHISGLTKKEELMNPKLKDIVMDVNVGRGVIHVKPFVMKLAGFDTEITGKHELTGSMNYVLKIALPPFDIVKIPLHVSGTYDNPKVHLGKGHEQALN